MPTLSPNSFTALNSVPSGGHSRTSTADPRLATSVIDREVYPRTPSIRAHGEYGHGVWPEVSATRGAPRNLR